MDDYSFDKEAYALGITDSVFPNGKRRCKNNGDTKIKDGGDSCDDRECGCFKDKLQEFVDYQIPQKYLDSHLGIPLTSEEGKNLFKEAVMSDYMECYYTISQNMEHQLENSCGITSLMVALNSLAIDPAIPTWYQEYRWHNLDSLACSTQIMKRSNVNLRQFACMAVCNDTLAYPVQVEDDWTVARIRSWIKLVTSRTDVVMVANFGRTAMGQKGIGHFLPISGYHEGRDMVLLVEIAKHKYPGSWMPLCILAGAMNDIDVTRERGSRGFVLLTRPDYEPGERLFGPSLLLRLDAFPGEVDPMLSSFMTLWNKYLHTEVPVSSPPQQILHTTVHLFLSSIENSKSEHKFSLLDLTLVHFKHNHSEGKPSSIIARCQKPHCCATCPNKLFCQVLQSLEIFKAVQACVTSMSDTDRQRILDLVICDLDSIDEAITYTKSTTSIRKSQMKSLANSLKWEKMEKEHEIKRVKSNSPLKKNTIMNAECPGYVELFPEHVLTFLLLSWPFDERRAADSVSELRRYIQLDAQFDSTRPYVEPPAVNSILSEALTTEGLFTNTEVNNNEENLRIQLAIEDFKKSHDFQNNMLFCDCENEPKVADCYVSMRTYLCEMMKSQLVGLSDPRYLRNHVKAMKRKLNVILHYHKLI